MKAPPWAAEEAARHIQDILAIAVEHSQPRKAVVVFDTGCELAVLLAGAYRHALPEAAFIDFDVIPPAAVLAAFEPLKPQDLVVLIQTTSFRLDAFRIRVELFQRGLKVIEHPHLLRMQGEQIGWYVDALAYDPGYYRRVGAALKEKIDGAKGGAIESDGESLIIASGFEPAKLNVGDYRAMKNVGGQFPIGEVFTEAKDLEAVNGRIAIFAFADADFSPNKPERPITLTVAKGRVTEVSDSTPAFDQVLAAIRADEGQVWVRELGFGLNRAFSPERMVNDIGTLERMLGMHLSLGAKHAVYSKPGFGRKHGKHHVDVFAAADKVVLEGEAVFWDGAWRA